MRHIVIIAALLGCGAAQAQTPLTERQQDRIDLYATTLTAQRLCHYKVNQPVITANLRGAKLNFKKAAHKAALDAALAKTAAAASKNKSWCQNIYADMGPAGATPAAGMLTR